jgi:hypothetical protein
MKGIWRRQRQMILRFLVDFPTVTLCRRPAQKPDVVAHTCRVNTRFVSAARVASQECAM